MKGSKLDCCSDRDKGGTGNKGKVKGKGKSEPDIATIAESKDELSIQVDQQTEERTKARGSSVDVEESHR